MLDRTRQYVSALSILLFAVCIGLPIWWKTTEVYRCPLPYKEIGALAKQQVPPELVFRVAIVALGTKKDGTEIDALANSVQEQLGTNLVSSNSARISVQYIIEQKTLSSEVVNELSSALDSLEDFSTLAQRLVPSSLDCYTIFLVPAKANSTVFISQYRHAVLPLKSQQEMAELTSAVVQLVRTVFGDLKQLEKTLKTATGKLQDRVDVESMRQLRASHGYQISFTLVNPDPSQLRAHWNIKDATESILLPFLRHPGVASLGTFTVNSQVFYFTDVKFKPRKDGPSYYVSPTDLPPMISSVESKLASHVSQLPSLNFIIYVPKTTEHPLHIRNKPKKKDDDASTATTTDAFLVPQWGGVVIYNPPEMADSSNATQSGGKESVRGGRRVDVQMEQLMPVFIAQLKMLLGLPPTVPSSDLYTYSTGWLGVTDWQVDQLLTSKMVESVSMATTSLISLVQLLDKVKNMVISDHIQQEVESSLLSIQESDDHYLKRERVWLGRLECYKCAAGGNMADAYVAAKRAMHSAETAFFDPSILELLYFPDDQKFAIYIPLFVPISVPIFLSSATALKWMASTLRATRESATGKTKHD